VIGGSAEKLGARFGLAGGRKLTRKADFENLLFRGRRQSWGGFAFFLARRTDGPPRLGMLVSRKHSPRATVRNHIKRCIREAFRLEQEALGSIDLLVRPPYGVRAGARMIAQLRGLLARVGK